MKTRFAFLMTALALAVAVGCKKDEPKKGDDNPNPGPGKGGAAATYKTPEEAFEAGKKAAAAGDFKTFIQCLAPETINQTADMFTGLSVMTIQFWDKADAKAKEDGKAMVDAAVKHGITVEAVKKLADLKAPEEIDKATKGLKELVKDKAGFVADIMAGMPEAARKGMVEEVSSSALKGKVEITGDKAKGTVAMKKGGKDVEEPIEFVKVGDSWRIIKSMK